MDIALLISLLLIGILIVLPSFIIVFCFTIVVIKGTINELKRNRDV